MEKCSISRNSANYGGTEVKKESVIDESPKCQKCQIRDKPMEPSSEVSHQMSRMNESQYDALCSCSENGQINCQCRKDQLWMTSKWRPHNWEHWPLLKKILIFCAVFCLIIWLLIYLILHFYYERH